MRLLRSAKMSASALLGNRVRTALALSAVAVGVSAVVLTSAIGAGTREEVLRKTESMGANLLVVRPAQIKTSAARKAISGVVTTLKPEDSSAIETLGSVAEAVPGVERTLKVKFGNNVTSALVLGTSPPYLEVSRLQIRQGRFFDDGDNRMARRVAVLGARVAENLFDLEDPIGHEMRVRGLPFEVIGVLQGKGVMADGSDQDNQVMIPIRTALRRVFNSTWLNPIFISALDAGQLDTAETEIAALLRERHHLPTRNKPDDFVIQNKIRVLGAQKQIADSLGQLSIALAAVSLLIGGTGILAVMLMSVKERTGEIGLRMAIGARPGDILLQFLFEAIALAAGGWVVGLALGAMAATVIAFSTTWKIAVSTELVFATLGLVVAAGLLFGAYPARKASLMPPIRALLVKSR